MVSAGNVDKVITCYRKLSPVSVWVTQSTAKQRHVCLRVVHIVGECRMLRQGGYLTGVLPRLCCSMLAAQMVGKVDEDELREEEIVFATTQGTEHTRLSHFLICFMVHDINKARAELCEFNYLCL